MRSDRIHLRMRLHERYSVAKPAKNQDDVIETIFLGWIDGQRCVNIASRNQVQRGRSYPDDGCRRVVQIDRAANDGAIASETPSPQALAEHRDRRRAGLFFSVAENAAGHGSESKHSQECWTHAIAGKLLGFA